MKKYQKYLLLAGLLLTPTLVFASVSESFIPLGFALVMESFVSIHMSVFVLKPLADIISKDNSNKIFWTMFIIRLVILIFFDFFVTPSIAMFDFVLVFIGAAIVMPITTIRSKPTISNNTITNNTNFSSTQPVPNNSNTLNSQSVKTINSENQEMIITCTNCGHILKVTDKFCSMCGTPFDGNNVTVKAVPKILVKPTDFDPMFSNSENKLLEIFITKELEKAGIEKNSKLIPEDVLKRKKILNIIFSVLVFIYISLIFFHFPIYTYIIGIIILLIFFKITTNYNLIKYLKKEIKARPTEKISNIVMNTKNSFSIDNNKNIRVICIIAALILPLIIFMNPRIMYEKVENGYSVRYYTFGLNNFKTATIPDTYKGKKVVSLRGNTFSNMPFLESVSLPDTITEIRGQAFKNDINLANVNIPSNLEYLGGGAFYNCSSIKNIVLPDTLTYMGGETFYGASSLESIELSNNLTEIRGNTFENCTSLKTIIIPDNITRIGGHAFYGNTALETVTFTENSKLEEIGSSAFRQCYSLYEITLPKTVYYSERAFKESPTSIKYFNYSD